MKQKLLSNITDIYQLAIISSEVKKEDLKILKDKSLMVIFSYAPAGFGHLRVTDALYHGLPKEVVPIVLGAQDQSITTIHRLTSIHSSLRKAMEFFQRGGGEEVFTRLYRHRLRSRAKILFEQMRTILEQHIQRPNTVLIISTHFGLAHQFGAIKKRLEQKEKLKIILVLQVTDDSPQKMWYVPEADIIFVPSEKTKRALEKYAEKLGFSKTQIEVVAYPINPLLGQSLSQEHYHNRLDQLDFQKKIPIHVAIPISGAAVGTEFFIKIIDTLSQKNDRFRFHIIVKKVPFTQTFIDTIMEFPNVEFKAHLSDREVVNEYESLYRNQTIALEITKPSEQAFKALLNPDQIGGALLLLANPIGRQEYDNLDFLQRHHLIPDTKSKIKLWEKANKGEDFYEQKEIGWRGVELPQSPQDAANFILWLLKGGFFSKMGQVRVKPKAGDPHAHELNPNGVKEFWQRIIRHINPTPHQS